MATNLALDDSLIDEARRIGRHSTKKAAVTAALEEYILRRKQLEYSICWELSTTTPPMTTAPCAGLIASKASGEGAGGHLRLVLAVAAREPGGAQFRRADHARRSEGGDPGRARRDVGPIRQEVLSASAKQPSLSACAKLSPHFPTSQSPPRTMKRQHGCTISAAVGEWRAAALTFSSAP